MHEDPVNRVHHPHPFHHDSRTARQKSINRASDSGPSQVDRNMTMTHSNTPVASYLPGGFHDSPQPMGKYYPSNWEMHNKQQSHHRPSVSDSIASASKTDSQLPPHAMTPTSPASSASAHPPSADAEARRRMQQYQRDMVAQAALALNGSGNKGMKLAPGLSIKDLRFGHGTPQKPVAPKLAPLGSPGPVTPMELEAAGGGYLDKGRGPERRARDSRPSASVGFAAHTIS